MLMVRLKLSYSYNYIKLVNGKTKIKLLLQLHSNIELMTEHDLRLDMCFPYKVSIALTYPFMGFSLIPLDDYKTRENSNFLEKWQNRNFGKNPKIF